MVNFKLVPEDYIYDNVLQPSFGLETSEEKRIKAELAEVEANEIGSDVKSRGLTDQFSGKSTLSKMFDFFALFLVVILVLLLVVCCKFTVYPKCPTCFKKILTKLERKLFWNSVLRACLETYLGTCIFVCVTMNTFETYTLEGKIEFFSWFGIGVYAVSFPFFTFNVLYR